MPPHLRLTSEQLAAAATSQERAFIEAAPGSGKTTVACERYGVLRFSVHGRRKAIVALSFTRSATRELRLRIMKRWGGSALVWPHRVATLDAFHYELVSYLLRIAAVRWPNGHTELQVLDTWRGLKGCRWLEARDWHRVACLAGREVGSDGQRSQRPAYGIGNRRDFEGHLGEGRCTHEEVRQVLAAGLRNPDIRAELANYVEGNLGALVVDEVFDANALDIAIIELVICADVCATLVGDPWQALYGFRGARPDLIPRLISRRGFVACPVTRSFRFETEQTRQLATDLRDGNAIELPALARAPDVVLASTWQDLWDGPDYVLPQSFGVVTNQTDAALVLLLDHVLDVHFGSKAMYLGEALVALRLPSNATPSQAAALLDPVVTILRSGTEEAARRALRILRETMTTLGTPRRISALRTTEDRQVSRLMALGARLSLNHLVPGLTIHQAKGREWPTVGVILEPGQVGHLRRGLSQGVDSHRALYVALTRARSEIGRVA